MRTSADTPAASEADDHPLERLGKVFHWACDCRTPSSRSPRFSALCIAIYGPEFEGGATTLSEAAKRAGMSERTLRNHLTELREVYRISPREFAGELATYRHNGRTVTMLGIGERAGAPE